MAHPELYSGIRVSRDLESWGAVLGAPQGQNELMVVMWMVGQHNIDCSVYSRKQRYGHEKNPKYDGIHLRGATGKSDYT